MEIRFLGTSNGFISSTRWQTGILVRDEITMLLDCGAPIAHLMAREKLKADTVDLIWLSHSHSDHIGQFPSLIQHLWLQKRTKPLRIMGPSGLLRRLRDWLPQCMLFPELLPFKIEWNEIPLKHARPLSFNGYRFTPFPTEHLYDFRSRFSKTSKKVCFETLAVRIEAPKKSFAFSADLKSPDDLDGLLGKPLDLLICELTHFTPESLFEKLAKAPIQKLILTHYPDRYARWEKKLQRLAVSHGFDGEVLVAPDGGRFTV